jgi:hypothetical protein
MTSLSSAVAAGSPWGTSVYLVLLRCRDLGLASARRTDGGHRLRDGPGMASRPGAVGSVDSADAAGSCRYQQEELLAALHHASLECPPSNFRESTLASKEAATGAFFVTLTKSESDLSPTTMYQDYAISPELFHRESHSTTSVSSVTGHRSLRHRELNSSIFFARTHQRDELGTSPYLFLGPATHSTHTGDRPIAITWNLSTRCRRTCSRRRLWSPELN